MSEWNEEHLSRLREGAARFNSWRSANLTGPNTVPYLVGADLSGLDLTAVNLSRAHLGQVKLCKAKLDKANLSNAKLGAADLTGASLRGANLVKAYFGSAALDGVDLTDAMYDQTTSWPSGFDPTAHRSDSVSATTAKASSLQPDHFIIRQLPPKAADVDRLIDSVLRANGYTRGRATVDFKVDSEATNQAYLMGLLQNYENARKVDTTRSKMHNFSGGATGKMIAVFHALDAASSSATVMTAPTIANRPSPSSPVIASQKTVEKKWWTFWK
jgi:uncharacterized protein YjbI with pentapeptide repeats